MTLHPINRTASFLGSSLVYCYVKRMPIAANLVKEIRNIGPTLLHAVDLDEHVLAGVLFCQIALR